MTEHSEELFKKLRIDFLFHNPFLSVLAMSLPVIYDEDQVCAFKTDGRRVFVNAERLQTYGEPEIKYQFAHILMHVILKHPFRMKNREEDTWNLASDLVINLVLEKMKNVGKRPMDEAYDERYEGMIAEEVYALLQEDNTENPTENEESEKKLDLIPNPDTQEGEEGDELDTLILQALNIARQQGLLQGSMGVEVDELLRPDVSLEEVLHEYLHQSLFEKESSYSRPNRKFIHQGLYLPGSVRPKESLHAIIAIDASISVSMEEYHTFLGTLREILENYYEHTLQVLPFDTEVKEELILHLTQFDSLSDSDLHIPKAEGGTDFDSVITYLESRDVSNDQSLLIILSDGCFEMRKNNAMEKLFLITDKENLSKFDPFGKTVQFRI